MKFNVNRVFQSIDLLIILAKSIGMIPQTCI